MSRGLQLKTPVTWWLYHVTKTHIMKHFHAAPFLFSKGSS
ncbi:hypothetical protein E2C01_027645 [Portunus trituberculatus]|uniref:Uncharacterized protein n=1 Tax=Portunus trituberculatus TaxID=210409 RepID=A0A5B7EIN1_PORTR|nr:hypothetical protein [Portunus trituberculatus]